MNILKFVKSLVPRLEQNNVLEDINITIKEIESNSIPSYRQAAEHFKLSKLKSSQANKLSNDFYSKIDSKKIPKQANFVAEILKRLENLQENATYVREQLQIKLEQDTINEGITAEKAILIRAADGMSFLSNYSMDLLSAIYTHESRVTNEDLQEDVYISPATQKYVDNNIHRFAAILHVYGMNINDFKKNIQNVPAVILSSRNESAIAGSYREKDLDPFTSPYIVGFTYNPIYHIRLVIAEWQASRYKVNKDKKKVLELKLMHLKLRNEGKEDAKLEREIEYVQSRIDKIDKYLKSVEDDLGVN